MPGRETTTWLSNSRLASQRIQSALADVAQPHAIGRRAVAQRDEAVDLDSRHARARAFHRGRKHVDDVDRVVEADPDMDIARPADGARNGLAAFEFDRQPRAFGDSAISAHHHPAGADVLDQAQFAAVVDHQRADAIKRHVPLAVGAVRRARRRGVGQGIECRLDRLPFNASTPQAAPSQWTGRPLRSFFHAPTYRQAGYQMVVFHAGVARRRGRRRVPPKARLSRIGVGARGLARAGSSVGRARDF